MNITAKIDKNNLDEYAAKLIGYALFFSGGTYGIKAIVTGLGMRQLETAASFVIYLIWFVLLFKYVMSNFKVFKNLIMWEVIYVGIMLWGYKTFPKTQIYFEESKMFIRQIISIFVPCGVIIGNMTNFENIIENMRKISLIGMILMIMAMCLGYTSRWGNQYLGVQTSPFILVLFANYIKGSRKIDLVLVLIGIFMLLNGGRQSLVLVVAGILCIYLFSVENKNKSSKNVLIFIAATLCTILFYVLGDVILGALANALKDIGISSRVVDKISSGELFDTSTRDIIYDSSIEFIKANGIKVSGFFGDRYWLRQKATWIVYCHNIILEFLLDFGILFGGVLFAVMMIAMIKTFKTAGNDTRSFGLIITFLSIGRLAVSSSFLIEGSFYMFLGYIMHKNREINGGGYDKEE